MMDSEGIEISLPVNFLHEALKSESSDRIRTCLFNTHLCDIKSRIQIADTNEAALCLFVCKTGQKVEWSNALKIHITNVCLDGNEINEKQGCQFDFGVSNTLSSAVVKPNLSFTQNPGVKVPNRKRGRPKKSCASNETKQKMPTLQTDGKRYSLRGVQISESIMNAEKGIECDNKEEEYESKGEECESKRGDEISSVSRESEDGMNASDYCGIDGKIVDDLEIFEGEGELKVTESKGQSKLMTQESNGQESDKRQQIDTNQSNSVLQEFTAECFSKLSKKMVNKLKDNKYVEVKQQSESNKQNLDQSSTCPRCGKSYKNFQTLRNHIRYVHKTTGQQNQCTLCPAKFKHMSVLKQHFDEIHNKKVNYTCTVCKKDFSRKNQFNRHMLSHGVDKSKHLKCPQCDKGFWFKYNLTRHMELVHKPTTENFHCSYCGKGFNLKAAMVSHVQQVHFNIFPFPCSVEGCKLVFSRQKQLLDHMRQTHSDVNFEPPKHFRGRYKYGRSDEDLFFCSHCRVSFCYKAKLVEHMHFAHNDSFPYVCDHCSQGFVEKSFLLHHLKYAHKQDIDSKAIQEASKGSDEDFEFTESEESDANCKIIMVDEAGKVLQICQPITKDTTATLEVCPT